MRCIAAAIIMNRSLAPSSSSSSSSSVDSLQFYPSFGDPNCIVLEYDSKTKKFLCSYYLYTHHDIDLTHNDDSVSSAVSILSSAAVYDDCVGDSLDFSSQDSFILNIQNRTQPNKLLHHSTMAEPEKETLEDKMVAIASGKDVLPHTQQKRKEQGEIGRAHV